MAADAPSYDETVKLLEAAGWAQEAKLLRSAIRGQYADVDWIHEKSVAFLQETGGWAERF